MLITKLKRAFALGLCALVLMSTRLSVASTDFADCEQLVLQIRPETALVVDEQFGPLSLGYIQALARKLSLFQEAQNRGLITRIPRQVIQEMALIQTFQSGLGPRLRQYQGSLDILAEEELRAQRGGPIDVELRELALEESTSLQGLIRSQSQAMIDFFMMALSNGGDSAIVEIHQPEGYRLGEDAIAGLYRMYSSFARRQRWEVAVMQESYSENGRSREHLHEGVPLRAITFRVRGPQAFTLLRMENGIHRIVTIGGGGSAGAASQEKTHTRLAQVRVYQEPPQNTFEFREDEVEITTFRSSGAGGQHVNKTESAVRAKHIETGIEVVIRSERSQHANRAMALDLLRAKLYERHQERERARLAQLRQEGSGAAAVRHQQSPWVRSYDFRYNPHIIESWFDGDIEGLLRDNLRRELANLIPELQARVEQDITDLERLLSGARTGDRPRAQGRD